VFAVEAATVRPTAADRDRRFSGLGHRIGEGMSVAIDGEIYQNAWQARLGPDIEIVLIPKISGARAGAAAVCCLGRPHRPAEFAIPRDIT